MIEAERKGRMSSTVHRTLYWAPRVLTIAFTLFISMFALDVLGHGRGFWATAAELMVHLVPSFVLIAMLLLAWRWEWIGAVVSAALLTLFLWWNFTVRHNVPSAVLLLAGPLALMTGLYLYGWIQRRELRRRSRSE